MNSLRNNINIASNKLLKEKVMRNRIIAGAVLVIITAFSLNSCYKQNNIKFVKNIPSYSEYSISAFSFIKKYCYRSYYGTTKIIKVMFNPNNKQ